MKFLEEIIAFGKGSRLAQSFALGSVGLLTSHKLGLATWQTLGFGALVAVYMVCRAARDVALVKAGKKDD